MLRIPEYLEQDGRQCHLTSLTPECLGQEWHLLHLLLLLTDRFQLEVPSVGLHRHLHSQWDEVPCVLVLRELF